MYKKLFYCFSVALLTLFSCEKEEVESGNSSGNNTVDTIKSPVFYSEDKLMVVAINKDNFCRVTKPTGVQIIEEIYSYSDNNMSYYTYLIKPNYKDIVIQLNRFTGQYNNISTPVTDNSSSATITSINEYKLDSTTVNGVKVISLDRKYSPNFNGSHSFRYDNSTDFSKLIGFVDCDVWSINEPSIKDYTIKPDSILEIDDID